jgi:hypothetical protein
MSQFHTRDQHDTRDATSLSHTLASSPQHSTPLALDLATPYPHQVIAAVPTLTREPAEDTAVRTANCKKQTAHWILSWTHTTARFIDRRLSSNETLATEYLL